MEHIHDIITREQRLGRYVRPKRLRYFRPFLFAWFATMLIVGMSILLVMQKTANLNYIASHAVWIH